MYITINGSYDEGEWASYSVVYYPTNMVADILTFQWLVLRYAILELEVIQAAILLAKQEGLLVSLDLASFEVFNASQNSPTS